MDMAINQLGRGDYEHAIDINGPDDLKKLGARLDWLRSELKDLHTKKQRFLQQASHELKTPLTAIREASELLNDGTAGKLNTQQTEITRILKESSLRLQKMIENLLKYNENTFNATQANVHFQALKPIINSIVEAYALSITQKNISINQLVGDVDLVVDAAKLSLILDNLISNAVKFTPNNGFITLQTTKTSDCVNIHIEDSGIGISKANQVHLFDAFYRGDDPENSLIKGSGLGLFIAKEAALSIHADIQLLPSNTGAHFMVSVPIQSKNIA
jgi:two-component system, NtrC family, sensor histidine kinase GlrK